MKVRLHVIIYAYIYFGKLQEPFKKTKVISYPYIHLNNREKSQFLTTYRNTCTNMEEPS